MEVVFDKKLDLEEQFDFEEVDISNCENNPKVEEWDVKGNVTSHSSSSGKPPATHARKQNSSWEQKLAQLAEIVDRRYKEVKQLMRGSEASIEDTLRQQQELIHRRKKQMEWMSRAFEVRLQETCPGRSKEALTGDNLCFSIANSDKHATKMYLSILLAVQTVRVMDLSPCLLNLVKIKIFEVLGFLLLHHNVAILHEISHLLL
ncbi:hypothetical protein L2E82_10782 [Cichorium intybus]|uniref:Uncharacterized protein n=1 Tax=Cichorium intybus TaxID=13427 RepID=A0ACB9GCR6_CICIN|nr:hypothetical protein L2E82_10782 [Cichorium intybus]